MLSCLVLLNGCSGQSVAPKSDAVNKTQSAQSEGAQTTTVRHETGSAKKTKPDVREEIIAEDAAVNSGKKLKREFPEITAGDVAKAAGVMVLAIPVCLGTLGLACGAQY